MDNAINSVFLESTFYWDWSDNRRDIHCAIYRDCVVRKRLDEQYGKRHVEVGFKFDFILISFDDCERECYFYGFSESFYKSKGEKKMIRDIYQTLVKSVDDDDDVIESIESMTTDLEVFNYEIPFISDDSSSGESK